jgi:hypothetical protein
MTIDPINILDPWEQALEDAQSVSLGLDPYDVTSLAKSAIHEDMTYVQIPISMGALTRIHRRAESQNKTTTTYLHEVVEYA